jgi:hypothetical protein
MDEEHAERPIPAFGDPKQGCFPSRGMLTGPEPEPGGELAPILEYRRIAHGRDVRCGRQGANPAQLCQPLTCLISLEDLLDAVVGSCQPLIESLEFLGKGLQPLPCCDCQTVLRIVEHKGQFVPHLGGPLRDHEPLFCQQSTDLID